MEGNKKIVMLLIFLAVSLFLVQNASAACSNGGQCTTCKKCSGTSCVPELSTEDTKNECNGRSCSSYYVKTGTASASTTEYCYQAADVTAANHYCNGNGACQSAASLCPSQPADTGKLQYSCGLCQSIQARYCTGTNFAPVSSYNTDGSPNYDYCYEYPDNTACSTTNPNMKCAGGTCYDTQGCTVGNIVGTCGVTTSPSQCFLVPNPAFVGIYEIYRCYGIKTAPITNIQWSWRNEGTVETGTEPPSDSLIYWCYVSPNQLCNILYRPSGAYPYVGNPFGWCQNPGGSTWEQKFNTSAPQTGLGQDCSSATYTRECSGEGDCINIDNDKFNVISIRVLNTQGQPITVGNEICTSMAFSIEIGVTYTGATTNPCNDYRLFQLRSNLYDSHGQFVYALRSPWLLRYSREIDMNGNTVCPWSQGNTHYFKADIPSLFQVSGTYVVPQGGYYAMAGTFVNSYSMTPLNMGVAPVYIPAKDCTTDNTAPTTTISPDGNSPSWSGQDIPFTLTCTDNSGGMGCKTTYYKIIDSAQTCPSTPDGTFQTGNSGTVTCPSGSACQKKVCYYSDDNAPTTPNTESIKTSNTFQINKVPVTCTVSINSNAQYATSTSASLSLTTSGGTEWHCENSGGSWDSWSSVTPRAWMLTAGDGTKTVNCEARNSLAVTGSCSDTIILDQTAPSTTDNANSNWRNSDMTVTLTCSDATSGCSQTRYCVDTTGTCSPSAVGNSVSVTCASGSVCQQQYVRYQSQDNAGNWEGIKSSVVIRIDKSSPTVAVSPSPATPTNSDTVTFTATASDTGSGLSAITIFVDGIQLGTTCASSPCVRTGGPYSAGTHTYYATATDVVGNTGRDPSSGTKSFTVTSCQLTTYSISLTDSNSNGVADLNEVISMSGSYTGSCTANFFQIDAHSLDGTCNIQYSTPPGDISGIFKSNPTIGSGSVSGTWTITSIPPACSGKTVSTTAAALYQGGPPGTGTLVTLINSPGSGSFRFRDVIAPTTTINPNGRSWTNQDIPFTLSCSDSGGGTCQTTYYKIIDNGQSCGSGFSTGTSGTVSCTGSVCAKSVCYYSVDSFGNTESVQTSNVFQIDKQLPATTDNSSSVWTSADQTISLTCNDGTGSGCSQTRYCVDTTNSCTPTTSGSRAQVTCPLGSTCTQYVRYYSMDVAGNSETVKSSQQIRIDKQGPAVTVTINNGAAYANSESVTLSLTYSDTGSGIKDCRYSNDGVTYTTWEACAATKAWTLTSGDGAKTVYYQAEDNAGSIATATDQITLDKTAPSASMNPLPPWTRQNGFAVSWSGSDATSGVAGYSIDYSATWSSGTPVRGWTNWIYKTVSPPPATFGPASPMQLTNNQTYLFRVNATDNAGNTGSYSVSVSTTFDSQLPEINYDVNDDRAGKKVTITSVASDGISGIFNHTINCTTINPSSTIFRQCPNPAAAFGGISSCVTLQIPYTSETEISCDLRAEDRAGNIRITNVFWSFSADHPLAEFAEHNVFISMGETGHTKIYVRNLKKSQDMVNVTFLGEYPAGLAKFLNSSEILSISPDRKNITVLLNPYQQKTIYAEIISTDPDVYILNLSAGSLNFPITDSDFTEVTIGFPAAFPGMEIFSIIGLLAISVLAYRKLQK